MNESTVEWYSKEHWKLLVQIEQNRLTRGEYSVKHQEILEKAKEMEKQEKIDFADKYGTYLLQGGIMSAAAYNETFKSE